MTSADSSRRRPAGPAERRRERRTVLLAGRANLAIAVAKLVGGLLSGSSAMFAEAAHSVA